MPFEMASDSNFPGMHTKNDNEDAEPSEGEEEDPEEDLGEDPEEDLEEDPDEDKDLEEVPEKDLKEDFVEDPEEDPEEYLEEDPEQDPDDGSCQELDEEHVLEYIYEEVPSQNCKDPVEAVYMEELVEEIYEFEEEEIYEVEEEVEEIYEVEGEETCDGKHEDGEPSLGPATKLACDGSNDAQLLDCIGVQKSLTNPEEGKNLHSEHDGRNGKPKPHVGPSLVGSDTRATPSSLSSSHAGDKLEVACRKRPKRPSGWDTAPMDDSLVVSSGDHLITGKRKTRWDGIVDKTKDLKTVDVDTRLACDGGNDAQLLDCIGVQKSLTNPEEAKNLQSEHDGRNGKPKPHVGPSLISSDTRAMPSSLSSSHAGDKLEVACRKRPRGWDTGSLGDSLVVSSGDYLITGKRKTKWESIADKTKGLKTVDVDTETDNLRMKLLEVSRNLLANLQKKDLRIERNFFKKLYLPIEEYPGYNFHGILLGPCGNTHRRMEMETGATIRIRGKGTSKKGKRINIDDDDDPYVLVEADNKSSLDAAISMVEKLLVPLRDDCNEHKRAQLMELASLKAQGYGVEPGVAAPIHTAPASTKAPDMQSSPFVGTGEASGEADKAIDKADLYVGHLPSCIGDDELFALFSFFGSIESAQVIKDEASLSKGYGFVKFADPASASKAIIGMNKFNINGQTLAVRVAGCPPSGKAPRLASLPPFRGPKAIAHLNPSDQNIWPGPPGSVLSEPHSSFPPSRGVALGSVPVRPPYWPGPPGSVLTEPLSSFPPSRGLALGSVLVRPPCLPDPPASVPPEPRSSFPPSGGLSLGSVPVRPPCLPDPPASVPPDPRSSFPPSNGLALGSVPVRPPCWPGPPGSVLPEPRSSFPPSRGLMLGSVPVRPPSLPDPQAPSVLPEPRSSFPPSRGVALGSVPVRPPCLPDPPGSVPPEPRSSFPPSRGLVLGSVLVRPPSLPVPPASAPPASVLPEPRSSFPPSRGAALGSVPVRPPSLPVPPASVPPSSVPPEPRSSFPPSRGVALGSVPVRPPCLPGAPVSLRHPTASGYSVGASALPPYGSSSSRSITSEEELAHFPGFQRSLDL